LLSTKVTAVVVLTIAVALNFGHGLMFAPESTYFPELFGAEVRYSGASFGFQLSAAIGGGFAPLIATALAGYTGSTAGVSIMLILLALITLTAALFARETKDDPSFGSSVFAPHAA
jgi:MHS family shikimate/dehydroshikimate transporter-like MFS transporter